MRITPVILFAIGLWGLFYPETLIEAGSGGGRWVFAVIIGLGVFLIWRTARRSKS